MCQHHSIYTIYYYLLTYFIHLIILHNAQLKYELLSFYYYLALFPFAGYEPNTLTLLLKREITNLHFNNQIQH
jgi:hypothetical protein